MILIVENGPYPFLKEKTFSKNFSKIQDDIECLLNLALVEMTSFDEKNIVIKPSDEKFWDKEVISNAISFFVELVLPADWDTIYEKYCQYIKDGNEFLSVDELGCLAKAWNVSLTVKFPQGFRYSTDSEVTKIAFK